MNREVLDLEEHSVSLKQEVNITCILFAATKHSLILNLMIFIQRTIRPTTNNMFDYIDFYYLPCNLMRTDIKKKLFVFVCLFVCLILFVCFGL